MLVDSPGQIPGYARIEGPGAIGEDIDIIRFGHGGRFEAIGGWETGNASWIVHRFSLDSCQSISDSGLL